MKTVEYYMPTRVISGENSLSQIGSQAAGMGKKALLVTGKAAMRKLGITDRVIKYLKSEKIDVTLFDQVESNPKTEIVKKGAEIAKSEGCDLIIGVGGGSTIDTCKGIAVVATQGGDIEDYREERKIIKGPLLPILAVPTTSGTGSEVTPYSVFTSGKAKFAVRSPFTFPRVAILDPLLMTSQSPYLTACTGMDALTHAVEAFVSRSAQPISDALAAQAIYLISRNLRKAVWTGDDIQARENMAVASNLAGMAIAQAGAGAAHGLGMVVGGFFDTDHGTTVGLLLPYIMEYNLSARLEKYAQVAYLMGERVEALSLREAALKAVNSVKNLIKDINLPSTLSEIGVRRESIDEMAKETLKQGAMKKNPKVMQIEDILELYQKCI